MVSINPTEPSAKQTIEKALELQDEMLPGVSRTFALTIPQLPHALRVSITNAYLLCRIADTIEDDVELDIQQKKDFHQRFISIVENKEAPDDFAARLSAALSDKTIEAERLLVKETATVIQVTRSLNQTQQTALLRCISIMCKGMPDFQRANTASGLKKMNDMDRYCYYVAGVVGEMLTELFCDYSPAINENKSTLMALSTSFGQGLQMTNILKDIWDDQQANACWLPQEVFERHGLQLEKLSPTSENIGFEQGMTELIGIAHGHLDNALKYTTLIPKNETGIRRFCLWAIGMAVLTLRNIHNNPSFVSSEEVKISRSKVKATVFATSLLCRSDRALGMLFNAAQQGMPKQQSIVNSTGARV